MSDVQIQIDAGLDRVSHDWTEDFDGDQIFMPRIAGRVSTPRMYSNEEESWNSGPVFQ
jgi:hypothetical protein